MNSILPAWLINLGDRLRTSFWFLPFLMAAAAIALAFVMAQVDYYIERKWSGEIGWLFAGGAAGARAVLSTLAGSMINVAGVVYSITVVVLTLASSQFGPRLMRNFIGDRVNQTVLGIFVASFVYCLLVLRGIGAPKHGSQFVPNLSVTVGVGMGVLSLLVLIYFIHHIATSIQAFSVISTIGRELQGQIQELFPHHIGDSDDDAAEEPHGHRATTWLTAGAGGYLRLVDDAQVMRFALEHDVVVEIRVRPGDFIVAGDRLAALRAAERMDEEELPELLAAFILGDQRTNVQDADFSIDQLVEIGLRALSPGVNDPFTAIQCIHRLREALAHLVRQSMPSPWRLVDGQRLVLAPPHTFASFVARVVDPLRLAAARQPQVLVALLETLATAQERCSTPARRSCLEEHARAILATAREALPTARDRMIVEDAAAPVLKDGDRSDRPPRFDGRGRNP